MMALEAGGFYVDSRQVQRQARPLPSHRQRQAGSPCQKTVAVPATPSLTQKSMSLHATHSSCCFIAVNKSITACFQMGNPAWSAYMLSPGEVGIT